MGKMRPYLFLAVAVVVALAATLLIVNRMREKDRAKELVLAEQVPIAVAVNDLPPGTVLGKGMVKQADFLKKSLPAGYFSDLNAVVGRVLIFPVRADEPVFEFRLAPTNIKTGGVAAVITPKKRAVAVKVDKVIGVSGFIHAGNRVDVLVTIPSGKRPEPITKTVLENILVLAAGQEIEYKGKEEKASPVDVITLEVTPDEAEKLSLGATEGRLQLVLRNFNDAEDVLTKGATIPALLASYAATAGVREAKAGGVKGVRTSKPVLDQPQPFSVELIKGNKLTELKMEGKE